MSLGLKLLVGLIDAVDGTDQFARFRMEPSLFVGEAENKLFTVASEHLKKYGKLPSRATVDELTGGIPMPSELPEPPAFYLDRIKERYVFLRLRDTMKHAETLMNDDRSSDALQALMATTSLCHVFMHKDRIVDFVKEGHALVKVEYLLKLAHGDDYGLKLGWPTLDAMTGGLTGGDLVSIIGRPGCVSGDTRVYVARKGTNGSGRWYTVKQLYERFHGGPIACGIRGRIVKRWDSKIPTQVQSLKGERTGLNGLTDVVYSGRKVTYTVTTETGKTIRATADHKFLTQQGFRPLSELGVGDRVVCKAPNKSRRRKRRVHRREHCTKLPYSQYQVRMVAGIQYHRVRVSRLAYDVGLNGVSSEQFIYALKHDPNHGFVFSDPDMQIHHVNGDSSDDRFENLKLVTASEHTKLHAEACNMHARLGRNEVTYEAISSVVVYGEEDTYDLCCAAPHHNFIANEFVVHNSGKTYLALYAAFNAWKHKHVPMFVSMEMKPLLIAQRLAALTTSKSITQLKNSAMSDWALADMSEQLQVMAQQDQPFWLIDGALSSTVDDLILLARQLRPTVMFVDGAYLLRETSSYRGSKWERLANIAERLKAEVAEQLNIPVVLTYQFNRDMMKKKKNNDVVGLEDIAGTDAIGQLSSLVLGMIQEDSIETLRQRKLQVLKGRSGEQGSVLINWNFDVGPNFMDFSELPADAASSDLAYT